MKLRYLTEDQINAFDRKLYSEEKSAGTRENYVRYVRAFASWLDGRALDQGSAAAWKAVLLERGYKPGTINSMLVAVNRFLDFVKCPECRVKPLRVQRRLFRDAGRELERSEYERLISTAQKLGKERLALLMETICAAGIRVSEVRYITVEAAQQGKAEISLKGKIRTILIPGKLARKLLKYAKKQKTVSGEIFRTRNGKGLTRKQIWAEMKALCEKAGVQPSKVFPHNLRHLFARTFYNASHNVAQLADVLGHSSIETTRIYLISTGAEHARQLERLGLVS